MKDRICNCSCVETCIYSRSYRNTICLKILLHISADVTAVALHTKTKREKINMNKE